MHSVQFFLFEAKAYLGGAGEGGHFEAFDVAGLSSDKALGKSAWTQYIYSL